MSTLWNAVFSWFCSLRHVQSIISGVVQGIVIGPLLFLLLINDIIPTLTDEFCKCRKKLQYAWRHFSQAASTIWNDLPFAVHSAETNDMSQFRPKTCSTLLFNRMSLVLLTLQLRLIKHKLNDNNFITRMLHKDL